MGIKSLFKKAVTKGAKLYAKGVTKAGNIITAGLEKVTKKKYGRTTPEKFLSTKTGKVLASGAVATGLVGAAIAGGLGAKAGLAKLGAGSVKAGAAIAAQKAGSTLLKTATSPVRLLKVAAGGATLATLGGFLSTRGGRSAVTSLPETAFKGGEAIGKIAGGDVSAPTLKDAAKAGLLGLGVAGGVYAGKKIYDKVKGIGGDLPPGEIGGVAGLEQFPAEPVETPKTQLEAQMPKINNVVQVANYIN